MQFMTMYQNSTIIRGLRTGITDEEKLEIKKKTVFKNLIMLKRMLDKNR